MIDKTTELDAVSTEQNGKPAELITEPARNGLALWGNKKRMSVTNFKGDARAQFAFRLACESPAARGDEALNVPIPVTHWLLHEVEFENKETGETVETFRSVLVTADGESYAFVSDGVAKGIQQLHESFGLEPIDPPVWLEVTQKATKGGRRMYVIVPSEEPDDDEPEQPSRRRPGSRKRK